MTLMKQIKWIGRRVFIAILGPLLLLSVGQPSTLAQGAKSLTILYSNNINGEIDPCPS